MDRPTRWVFDVMPRRARASVRRAMHRHLRVAAFVLAAFVASCAAPGEPRELVELRAERRLAPVLDRVISFRDGLLREALDRGRIDREDRADAAKHEIAELTLLLDAVPPDLDVDAAVDRDIARMLLDAAVLDMTLAHAKEPELRRLAGPAMALAFLADPAPPSSATIALLAGGADGVYPKTAPE